MIKGILKNKNNFETTKGKINELLNCKKIDNLKDEVATLWD